MIHTLKWEKNILIIIDQTKLPTYVEYIECKDYKMVIEAIKKLEVRGAPAIGAAGAFALVLATQKLNNDSFYEELENIKNEIIDARPTAVNLFWAVDRVWKKVDKDSLDNTKNFFEEEAQKIFYEDIFINEKIGEFGAALFKDKINVLTHCNAGALATCGWGTALGVIRSAHELDKINMVFADETRPLLQGSRITAWELSQDNIPVTVITDNMAGWVMKNKMIDIIITGADRIALNGDTANKIGTYSLAVLAKEHKIPFYIAAPKSTIDFSIKTGAEIPIEEREHKEVLEFQGVPSAPKGVHVFNPAFDVTPNEFITGIITEYGVIYPSYEENIKKLKFQEAK